MSRCVSVRLHEREIEALRRLALTERRHPADQGGYLLANALRAIGALREGSADQARLLASRQLAGPPGGEPSEGQLLTPLRLVLALKAGDARGPVSLRVDHVLPDGSSEPGPEVVADFPNEESSDSYVFALQLRYRPGRHWFDVWAVREGRLLTRIPFRMEYQVVQIGNAETATPLPPAANTATPDDPSTGSS